MYYYKQENQEGLKKLTEAYTAKTGVKISLLIVPNDADATIDTYLGARYSLPLATPSVAVEAAAAAIEGHFVDIRSWK